ncbi:hypothetical protein [Streptomyces sp. NPDC014623]|uniref:hypothetical protein n=1 Tax=Streptomyces sp. NPDC014623 TaxID=3364875 RepID=UPI0036FDC5CD
MTTSPDSPSMPPQAPPDPDTIQPEEPLPGVRLYPPAEFVVSVPSPDRVPLDNLPFHSSYEKFQGQQGYRNSEGPGQGFRRVSGKVLHGWLSGSCVFWRSSEVRITDDGVIRYRKTPLHAVLLFNPDRTSPIVINRPTQQITGEAYRVTGPGGAVQVWRGQAVRNVVEECLRPGPIDWPDGWAELTATQTVRFQDRGFPWSEPAVYTAEPISDPVVWGPPCTVCSRYASEHDPNRRWGRPDCRGGWTTKA